MAKITGWIDKDYWANDCEKPPLRIQRTIPPTAAPVDLKSLFHGLIGIFGGERHLKRLEEELKGYFGVKYVYMFSSGKASLTIILKTLKALSPEKNQVIIPAYNCFSVPSAIIKAGLKVLPCDIDPLTLDFDYRLLDKAVNEKTLCIIPTHLFGIPSDIGRTIDICRDKNIFVVEDAAQAMGGQYNERLLGTIGDVGFYSFGRGKNVTSGSGGIIVTNNERIASEINREYSIIESPTFFENIIEYLKMIIMSIFIYPDTYWFPSGLPSLGLGETIFYKDFFIKKLSNMQAGLMKNWKKRLEMSNHIRRENTAYFNNKLSLKRFRSKSDYFPLLRLPFLTDNKEERDMLFSISERMGMGFSKMYPYPINEIIDLSDKFINMSFPFAKQVSEKLITIPVHQLIREKDKEEICRLYEEARQRQQCLN